MVIEVVDKVPLDIIVGKLGETKFVHVAVKRNIRDAAGTDLVTIDVIGKVDIISAIGG